MEVLSSRVLLQPVDFERSLRFYAQSLGLHVYRQWGSGSTRGVVFFLGGGFLELSGSSRTGATGSVRSPEALVAEQDGKLVGAVVLRTTAST